MLRWCYSVATDTVSGLAWTSRPAPVVQDHNRGDDNDQDQARPEADRAGADLEAVTVWGRDG